MVAPDVCGRREGEQRLHPGRAAGGAGAGGVGRVLVGVVGQVTALAHGQQVLFGAVLRDVVQVRDGEHDARPGDRVGRHPLRGQPPRVGRHAEP
ncbi:hypothetical protein D5H75_39760 [Bailinhaonella thermotolerans]|uniref:Uncharacterized protein n=1 Tax=Bailinhaonella thermotolerans TaxID=1070861 RepID=A0A3A4A472_9ACTN|nr:hypothetical protein D5H75_39760 [Bailinhaonella thermotolerans]